MTKVGFANEAQAKQRKGDKKFYRLLQDLECRLQELGERADYSVPGEPTFAVDTLSSAIYYVTGLEDAKEGLLLEVAHDMIACDKERQLLKLFRELTGIKDLHHSELRPSEIGYGRIMDWLCEQGYQSLAVDRLSVQGALDANPKITSAGRAVLKEILSIPDLKEWQP
jgi:hypothetical protein